MLTAKKKATIINLIAIAFGWAAFGLGIAALSNTLWQITATKRTGLFRECDLLGSSCNNTPETPWLLAVRAFLIMMVILDVIATSMISVGWCFKNKAVMIVTAGIAIYVVSGVFGVTALSVFTASTTNSTDNYYGRTFIEGWIAAWCPLISSVVAYIVLHMFKNGSNDEECGERYSN